MFSVFDTGGALFRGSMEDLQRVSHTMGLTRTRRLDPVLDHLQNLATQSDTAVLHGGTVGSAGRSVASHARHEYTRNQSPGEPARHRLYAVSDVMSRQVVTVGMHASVQDAWQTLLDARVGQAPVLSPQGKLVGMLTRAELLSLDRLPSPDQAALVWRALLMQPVSAVMISPVAGVSADTDIRRLAHVLLATDLPGLPVLNTVDGLEGFVSRSDILKALVHDPPVDLWT